MTSRNLFFNLSKEDGKQRLWSMAVAFLMFFFILPVGTALVLDENIKQEMNHQYIISELQEWLGIQNGFMVALIIFLSLIMGVTSFSYLHSRQKVDFYHGIPVNRKHLFWANYMNGILIAAAAYGINLLLALGVIGANRISPVEVAGASFTGFLFFLIHYTMLYTVTVLAMILTGNILIGIFGTLVFNFYSLCLLFVLELSYNQFFYTSYEEGKTVFHRLMDKFSPIALFFANIEKMKSGEYSGEVLLRITAVIIVTAMIAFLSFWLYKKRGSEAAGKAMAFKISMPIIRIPIVILISLCGSLFFWFIHSSLGWAVFGLVCGALLSHCFIEIIYHFEFRKLFSHWKQMIVSAVFAGALFCSFRYDFFGFDSYIPEESSIKSVAVSFDDTADWISYGDIWQDAEGDYNWRYISSNEYILNHMELKDTVPVLALVREAVERNQRLDRSSTTKRDTGDNERTYRFLVKYTMKNGKSIYRSYELSGEKIRPEIVRIYENPNFLNAVYPVLTQTPEDTAWVRVGRGALRNVVSLDRNGTDKAMTEKILMTYQEDLKNLKVETMQKENPVGSIQFVTRKQADAETKRTESQNYWQYGDVTERGYYPIYPSFRNTLELLKECQVDVDSWNNPEQIKEINIDLTQFAEYMYSFEKQDMQYLTITDPKMLMEIMEKASVEEYSNMNPFITDRSERISFSAVSESAGSKSEMKYTIPLNQLPQSVTENIEKIKRGV